MDEKKKDLLNTTANFTQLLSLFFLLRDSSNAQIMNEIKKIFKKLDEIEEKLNKCLNL